MKAFMTRALARTLILVCLAAIPICFPAVNVQAQTMVPPSGTVRGALAARIDEHLRRAEQFGFTGAVLIEQDGAVALHKGYGLADREHGTRVTAETIFDIGSITKPFTAAAILKLDEAGRLRVTDSIGRFFEHVPPDKAGITIHHLLTHTSGLPDGFGGDYDVMTRDSLIQLALASKLNAAPGAQYDYSNAGYSLLGAIVEKVSGQPYEKYLREQLLEPAGLRSTGYRAVDWSARPLAVGYRAGTRWGTPLEKRWDADGPYWHLRANGGLLSTVGDLYRWQVALDSGRILSATSYARATTPPNGSTYGYGLDVARSPRGTREIGHNGANGYFYAQMVSFPEDRLKLVFVTNDYANRTIEDDLYAMLFGETVRQLPHAAGERVPLADYAGRYRTDTGTEFEIRIVGERLEISPAPPAVTAALVLDSEPAPAHRLPASFDSALVRTIGGMAAGDFSSYRSYFMPFRNYQVDDETEFWAQVIADWRKELGEYRGSRVLGSMETGNQQAPLLTTYVTVQFAKGERMMRALQTLPRSEKFFLGTISPAQWPSRFVLAPHSADEFGSYSLELSKAGTVRFTRGQDGRVEAVVLPHGLRATKQ